MTWVLLAVLAYLIARDIWGERVRKQLQADLLGLSAAMQTLAQSRAGELLKLLDRFEQERQLLLTRIQAPEVGVALALEDEEPEKSYVGYDNDEEFAEAQRELMVDGS